MRKKGYKQYTIRAVSEDLDRLLRKRAREEQLSLNRAALQIIEKELMNPQVVEYRDLDFCIDSWEGDPHVDEALNEQRKIDQDLWR